MKKFIKWASIVIGAIIVVLVIGVVALPFVFPLEKIKDFAVSKLSETIGREVKIEKVSFDIFSGIKLEKLSIANRKGFSIQPFVAAESIELRYAFWPLFSRQIIIKEIRLVKPWILVEKNPRGEFNFSDLLQSKQSVPPTAKPPIHQTTKPPFDLFVSSVSIRNGTVTYADHSARSTAQIKALNAGVSGFELALIKPIEASLSAVLVYQGKDIPLALAGKAGVNMARETIEVPFLSLSIAGESVNSSATISGWKAAPSVAFQVRSKKINLDPLLAVFIAPAAPAVKKPALKPGELTGIVNRATASVPRNIRLKGDIELDNLSFQKLKADRVHLALLFANKKATADIKEIKFYEGTLSGKASVDLNTAGLGYELTGLKLTSFNAAPFTNGLVETFLTGLPDYKELVNKVYGTLDADLTLKGRGVEVPDILANAVGNGSFSIKQGELKRLKTLAEVGKTLKSTTLQENIKFGDLSAGFAYQKRVVSIKDFKLDNPEIKLGFNGGVDIGKLIWVPGNRLTLKLSPALGKDLPREFSIFKDEKGWLELTFEMTGQLKKPIPKPILEKPLETAVGKVKLKIEAKKVEIEQQAKQELTSKEAEARKALEEKAAAEKQRLQEEAKQKLKGLFR